jgi:hypothetical protein
MAWLAKWLTWELWALYTVPVLCTAFALGLHDASRYGAAVVCIYVLLSDLGFTIIATKGTLDLLLPFPMLFVKHADRHLQLFCLFHSHFLVCFFILHPFVPSPQYFFGR